jgi:hypothetical protein
MKWHDAMLGTYSFKTHINKHGINIFLSIMITFFVLVFLWAVFCGIKEVCPANDFINHYYR